MNLPLPLPTSPPYLTPTPHRLLIEQRTLDLKDDVQMNDYILLWKAGKLLDSGGYVIDLVK